MPGAATFTAWPFLCIRRDGMKVSRYLFAFVLLALVSMSAFAHREDYTGSTLVFLTLQKGELEPEYLLDVARTTRGDREQFLRHTLALEYGITEHWMIDGRITSADDDASRFGGAHIESRYRFGEEGARPVDVAVSAEVGFERGENGEKDDLELEPRLVLSKDVGRFNATANFVEVISSEKPSDFVVNSGVRFDATELFRFGSELSFDQRSRSSSVLPQVWLALPHELTFKLGVSEPIHRGDERFVRLVVEKEF